MAFDTGMSKEGKKIFKSTDENIQKNMKNLLSPEDLAILERNCKYKICLNVYKHFTNNYICI